MDVRLKFFNGKTGQTGEFVLLSSNAEPISDVVCKTVTLNDPDCGNIRHIHGCHHIQSYNIMLLEWHEGFACRGGLGMVSKAAWDKIETTKKTIILG